MIAESYDDLNFPVVEVRPSGADGAESAIRFLVQHLVELGQIRAEDALRVTSQVLIRESQGSTAFGGFAIPHSKSDVVGRVVGVIGRAPAGIPWAGSVGMPVREICLLVGPAQRPGELLRALHAMSARLRDGPWSRGR